MLLSIISLILLRASQTDAAATIKITDIVNNDVNETETSLSPSDFVAAPFKEVDLSLMGFATKRDPTMGNKSEGDIAIENITEFVEANNQFGRNAIRDVYSRWPDGVIPYTLSSRYGSYARSVIAKAMQIYHEKTCIKFVPRDPLTDRDYLYLQPDDGCYSQVGRIRGRQIVSLDGGCMKTGTILHELMHAIGFFHEHSRADRDKYIDIVWHNVEDGADDQFLKYSLRLIDHLNEPYDYSSILHYGPDAFSKNGQRTIVARKAGADRMGQRENLSLIDLRKINKLYACDEKSSFWNSINTATTSQTSHPTTSTTTTTTTTTQSPVQTQCIDKDWHCPFWSMSLFGYCETSLVIAHETCIRSCGNCQKAPATSTSTSTETSSPSTTTKFSLYPHIRKMPAVKIERRDLNPACRNWAKRGECDNPSQRRFMHALCPESCQFSQRRRPSKPSRCEDTEQFYTCKIALIFNECADKVDVCAKTCGAC